MKEIIGRALIITSFFLFLFGSFVSAHVTVNPQTSATGAWETYTLKVPVEKDIPSTKVTLKIPSDVQFMSYQPVEGWNISIKKNSKGIVKSVTFEAIGDGILPGQFQQFVFVAKNPEYAGKAAWDAYQFYKDGSIVEWTGKGSTQTPHSVTNIIASTTVEHHASTSGMEDHQEDKMNSGDKRTADKTKISLPLIFSIVSVILSLVAFITTLRKK
ncbi:DUF1775 domain-containing protein [Neobacillus sp. PS3-34]|uniref:YcnI family copper-binding membrane protein n=1 Tax=Neobacillus sp. PS3-34 TaxID=3070678 RepID=UPI0027DEACC5|nr:DUF1775 domain-containing protein [Neobacillus sp. PS3-34]WML48069.1 DUF1775 domain-containing protein [Neobacillus sp. PS3-34]